MATSDLDPLELLPDLLSSSAALRTHLEDRFSTFIDTMFEQLEETLHVGTVAEKQAVMKMVLPLLVRVKRDTEVSGDEVEHAQAEMRAVLAEMGSGLGALEEVEVDDA